SAGDNLTSAQMNALAIDLSNALDKTTAGDTLSGVVNVALTGQIAALLSGGPVNPGSPSNAAWYNSGIAQTWSCTPNQNNVIDTSQYFYYVVLTDESGVAATDFYGPMSA